LLENRDSWFMKEFSFRDPYCEICDLATLLAFPILLH